MASPEVVLRIMHGLAANFGRELTDSVLELYCEALSNISNADLEEAARRCLREDHYWPPIARLRDLSGHGIDAEAERAWEDLRPCFSTRKPVPRHLGKIVRALGGVSYVGGLSREVVSTNVHRRFVELYRIHRPLHQEQERERHAITGTPGLNLSAPDTKRIGRNST